MKKVVAGSVSALLILIIAAITIYYSERNAVLPADPVNAIPTDAAFFLELKNGKQAMKNLSSTTFFQELTDDESVFSINQSMRFMDSLFSKDEFSLKIWSKEKLFISAHPTKAADFDLLYLCNAPLRTGIKEINNAIDSWLNSDFQKSRSVYENISIYEIRKKGETLLTYAFTNGMLMVSRTSFLVEDAIRQLKTGVSIKKTKTFTRLHTEKHSGGIYLNVNFVGLQNLLNGFLENENYQLSNVLTSLSRWASYSTELKKNAIVLNGNMASIDSIYLVQAFAGQKSQNSDLTALLPSRTAFFLEFNNSNTYEFISRLTSNATFFEDYGTTKQQLISLSKKASIDLKQDLKEWLGNSISLLITESGSVILDNNSYACIRLSNTKNAIRTLKKLQQISDKPTDEIYRDHPIGTIGIKALPSLWFGNLFSNIENTNFGIINGYLIFANQISAIKSFIDDVEDKKLFSRTEEYKNLPAQYFNGNLNLYIDTKKGENIIRALGNEELLNALNKHQSLLHHLSGFAFSIQSAPTQINSKALILFSESQSDQINVLWSAQLDSSLQTEPYLVSGGNGNFITVQDKKNQLYLFDEAGRLMWKKQLPSGILSQIVTADYYKNGGSQLVFNTGEALYMLDLKGNTVGSFPVTLPAPPSSGCIISDQDGLKQFRIFIPCTNGLIYAYELTGKPVSDWLFTKFVDTGNEELQTYRYNDQWNLLIQGTNGNNYLADKRGRLTSLKTETGRLGISVFEDSTGNYLCGTNLKNELILFSPVKELKTASLLAPVVSIKVNNEIIPNSISIMTSDSLFTYDSDLQITNGIKLPAGNYAFTPSSYLKNTTGINDHKKNLFYILDKVGSLDDRFPVKGNTGFSIINTSNNSKRKLICGSDQGIIYMYSY